MSCTKAHVKTADGATGEVWVANDVGLTLFSRIEAPGMTTTKTLRKVHKKEPDPTLFTVPEGCAISEQTVSSEQKSIPPPTPLRSNRGVKVAKRFEARRGARVTTCTGVNETPEAQTGH